MRILGAQWKLETLSFHSNTLNNHNTIYVDVINMHIKFHLVPAVEKKIVKKNLDAAMATNQCQRFRQNIIRQQKLSNCQKKRLNIHNDTAEFANFHFSHYKSMKTISCHNNQSSYPIGQRTYCQFRVSMDSGCKE